MSFLNASPTPYHAVRNVKCKLTKNGFEELSERVNWAGKVVKGGKYFVTRNASSIIAFTVGEKWQPGNGISIVGAHTDSPCLRIKPVSKRNAEGFIQIGVELYGGGIWHSWFDSDLSIAGRVLIKKDGKIIPKLIDIKKPLLKIPTLAIHLDRDVNNKFEFDKESQLRPIAGLDNAAPKSTGGCCEGSKLSNDEFQSLKSVVQRHNEQLTELIAEEAGSTVDALEDFELVLYDHKPSTLGGLNEEFIFSARLDNLTSCFTAIEGLVESASGPSALKEENGIRLASLFDHEEIGSSSAQGADSNFLPNILDRITGLTGDKSTDEKNPGQRSFILESSAKSFHLSSDVAHGVHPNYAAKYESNHKPKLGEGPVIKINANQRYVTNSPGIALLKEVAEQAKVPLQLFVINNGSPCGSTIGPILASKTGIRTLDLGNGVLSMHSIRETSSSADVEKQVKLFKSFYDNFTKIEPTIIIDGE